MLGFQPYETFQLLIETGGVDRTNTLLIAACDAYVRPDGMMFVSDWNAGMHVLQYQG